MSRQLKTSANSSLASVCSYVSHRCSVRQILDMLNRMSRSFQHCENKQKKNLWCTLHALPQLHHWAWKIPYLFGTMHNYTSTTNGIHIITRKYVHDFFSARANKHTHAPTHAHTSSPMTKKNFYFLYVWLCVCVFLSSISCVF